MGGIYFSPRTRQPTRWGHPPTPPQRVNVGQSEPSDPPVFPLPDTGGSVFSGTDVGGGARSAQDAARPHLLVDEAVVGALAIAGCASRVQVLVRAQERVGGTAEPLRAGVEGLGRQVDLVHVRATGARVALDELPPEVPQRGGPHLPDAVDVASAASLLGLLERSGDVRPPPAAPARPLAGDPREKPPVRRRVPVEDADVVLVGGMRDER